MFILTNYKGLYDIGEPDPYCGVDILTGMDLIHGVRQILRWTHGIQFHKFRKERW